MKLSFPFFKKEPLQKTVLKQELVELRDIIAPPGIEIKQGYIKLGERFSKSFFIFSYPRYLSTGWLSPVVNMNCPLDVSLQIHPVDTSTILKQLRRKLTEIESEIMERSEKGLIRDPKLETA